MLTEDCGIDCGAKSSIGGELHCGHCHESNKRARRRAELRPIVREVLEEYREAHSLRRRWFNVRVRLAHRFWRYWFRHPYGLIDHLWRRYYVWKWRDENKQQ